MEILKEILGFLASPGGVVIIIAIFVFIIILVFKKPLESFFRTLIKVKFKGLEMEATGESLKSNDNNHNSLIQSESVKIERMEADINQSAVEVSAATSEDDDSGKVYLNKLIEVFKTKDKTKLNTIYQDFMKNESNKISKIKLEAFYYSFLYKLGEDVIDCYVEIEKRAVNTEAYPNVMLIFAHSFADMNDYDRAKNYIKKGIQSADYPNDILVSSFIKLAGIYFELGESTKAFDLLLNEISKSDLSDENRFQYYHYLSSLYNKNNNIDLHIYALEKAMKIKPNHTGILFSLAYAYSKINRQELAIYYYEILMLIDDKDASVINNLGVAYEELDMNYESIRFYEKASNLGNTLASANLAYRYMDIGFIDLAEKILENAKEEENVHENVNKALLEVQKIKKEETDNKNKKMEQAKRLKEFYNKLANARFEKFVITPKIFEGTWIFSDDESIPEIIVDNHQISIIFEKRKLVGEFVNRYISFDLYDKKYSITSKEYKFEKVDKVLGYIDSDGCKIHMLEYKDHISKIDILEKNKHEFECEEKAEELK